MNNCKFACKLSIAHLSIAFQGMTGINGMRNPDVCEWGCRALMDYARASGNDCYDLCVCIEVKVVLNRFFSKSAV